jgi:hypothetical protein
MSSIATGVVTDVGAVAGAVQETAATAGKVIDATEANKDKQAGIDAERATSLAATVTITKAQLAAAIDAPTTEAETIAALEAGEF